MPGVIQYPNLFSELAGDLNTLSLLVLVPESVFRDCLSCDSNGISDIQGMRGWRIVKDYYGHVGFSLGNQDGDRRFSILRTWR